MRSLIEGNEYAEMKKAITGCEKRENFGNVLHTQPRNSQASNSRLLYSGRAVRNTSSRVRT